MRIIIGIIASLLLVIPVIAFERWNEDKQCFDEDTFRGTFIETEPIGEIDDNWVSRIVKKDGCSFYYHPDQGNNNLQEERNIIPIVELTELPKTGADL